MVASDETSKEGEAPTYPSKGVAIAGRDRELSSLRQALAEVLAGRGRMVWLVGEAGIGKTCLVEALAEEARRRGVNVLSSRCWEGEGAPDLWPWIRLVRMCLRAVDEATLRALVGPHANELTALVAQSADAATQPAESTGAAVRFRVFNAITHLLDEYSRLSPLVLILEDLHWSDAQSLVLLQFLAQEQRQRPLLLAATFREPSGVANAELTRTVVETMRDPGTERLELSGLDAAATGVLLATLLDREPPAEFASSLQRRTGGNPLFLRELGRQIDDAANVADADSWPRPDELFISPELAELIDQRLAALSLAERAVLTSAAALGAEFSADSLRGGDGQDMAAEGILASLRAAERHGILVHGSEPDSHRFVQTLVLERLLEQGDGAGADSASGTPGADRKTPAPPATDAASLRREGEFWTVTFGGRTCRMRDSKGLAYIAFLLRHPGRPLHVTEVVHLGNAASSGSAAGRPRFDESTAVRRGLGDAGGALDQQAKAAYKQRYEELEASLDEARQFNDQGSIGRIEREMEFLVHEISSATGLGGRDRRAGSDAERARVNVTRSISRAIQKLHKAHPELARHLDQAIRTGTFCTYVAEPGTARTWDL